MMKKTIEKHKKPLTSLFLDKDKREALCKLLKSVKAQYRVYAELSKDDGNTNSLGAKGVITSNDMLKKVQLRRFAESMWNELQNEFFHTADISMNSIWRLQDEFEGFDETGYLLGTIPVELDSWAELLKGWYNREWVVEVLKLIKDFNLDNQNPEYVRVFKSDFKSARNEQEFVSAVYKWSDLIYWSPWKLSLLDNTFQQPRNVHYEDDFNPDVDDGEELF